MKTLSLWNVRTLVLAFGLLSSTGICEEAMIGGINWRYTVVNNAARIEGFANMPATKGQSVEELNRKMIMENICDKKLVIPQTIGKYIVNSIGDNAITLCDGPASITVPKCVTDIGTGAFLGNSHLKSVTLSPRLTSIPEALFHGCKNLKSITIPPRVKSIGIEAFADCQSIKAIVIPKSVESIKLQAFRDCSNLTSVTIPASVTEIGDGAFSGCSKLAMMTIEKGNRAYKFQDGALYSKDGTTLVQWMSGNPVTDVVIPDGVTNIGKCAFLGNSNIRTITIPANVTDIDDILAICFCQKLTVIYTSKDNCERIKQIFKKQPFDDIRKKVKVEAKAAEPASHKRRQSL